MFPGAGFQGDLAAGFAGVYGALPVHSHRQFDRISVKIQDAEFSFFFVILFVLYFKFYFSQIIIST